MFPNLTVDPQDSSFGHLFFSIFINNLPKRLSNAIKQKFAFAGKNVNHKLNEIDQCFQPNKPTNQL